MSQNNQQKARDANAFWTQKKKPMAFEEILESRLITSANPTYIKITNFLDSLYLYKVVAAVAFVGESRKEFRLKWIRGKIGLVSQEPVLFASSIKDNISYGKDGATNEEIKAAAELANAANFIDKMPQGLDTMVGEHGTQLSGGQKQRVAIARTILKDPRILLLDEATSALDAESERIVQEALDRVMANRTTVIVAHRLSTIRNADTIAEISLRHLAYLNKPEIPVLTIGSISAIVNGTIFPIFGILLSNAITTFYQPPPKMMKDSKFWSKLFLVLGFVSFIGFPARTYFFGLAGSRLIRRIRLMTFEKIVHMDVGWFDEPENSSGAIGARLSADAAMVRGLVGDTLALAVENATTLVAGLVIAFSANWQLTMIVLALLPLIGLNGWIQIKSMKGYSSEAKVCHDNSIKIIYLNIYYFYDGIPSLR
ncbi:ABC transporter B family member 4-like [Asparagus officinalis]|uniref:ABC transporter B family member 4-like n=1 Tax=Asparagus officinalis TaxID=4686 RepID=UPI00098E6452|nr:ABC transporter B family member 4-like [Asparagus officinalis]